MSRVLSIAGKLYLTGLAATLLVAVGMIVGAAWFVVSFVGVLEANGVHLRLF